MNGRTQRVDTTLIYNVYVLLLYETPGTSNIHAYKSRCKHCFRKVHCAAAKCPPSAFASISVVVVVVVVVVALGDAVAIAVSVADKHVKAEALS